MRQRLRVRPMALGVVERFTNVMGAKGTKTKAAWNSWQEISWEAQMKKNEEEKGEAEKEMGMIRRGISFRAAPVWE